MDDIPLAADGGDQGLVDTQVAEFGAEVLDDFGDGVEGEFLFDVFMPNSFGQLVVGNWLGAVANENFEDLLFLISKFRIDDISV